MRVKKSVPECILLIAMVSCLLQLTSCNTTGDTPAGTSDDLTPPVTRPLIMPEFKTINWDATAPQIISAPVIKPFDLDKIASKPFYIDGFAPFKKTSSVEKIQIDSLPAIAFDEDSVKKTLLNYRTIKIDKPVRIKATAAKTKTPVSLNITHLGQDEGLPGGVVHAIFKDSRGIYWIVTGKNICSYDGEYFNLYTFIEKEPQGNIVVDEIQEDKLHQLWFKTRTRGTYVLNYGAGTAKVVANLGYNFCNGPDNKLWILGTSSLNVVDPEKMTIGTISYQVFSDSGVVTRLINSDAQQLLLRTDEGLVFVDPGQKKIMKWKMKHSSKLENLFYLEKTRSGQILFSTDEGLDAINPSAGTVRHFGADQGVTNINTVPETKEDLQGRIWNLKKDSGIFILDLLKNEIMTIDKSDGLTENAVRCLFSDPDGQMWVGTESGGINIINTGLGINHISTKQGLSENQVWSIAQDLQDNIWVGNAEGIDVINMEQDWIKHIGPELALGKGYQSIPRISTGKNKLVWVLSPENALCAVDLEKKQVRLYDIKSLPKKCFRMFVDSKGKIWMSAYGGGMVMLDPQTNTIRRLNTDNGLAGNLVWTATEDADNQVWFATTKGLSILNASQTKIASLYQRDGLSDNVFQSVLNDPSGRMWAATNQGLDMIDLRAKKITEFTARQGLAENESYALEEMGGRIYAGTSSGISVISRPAADTNTWQIRSFARPQGLYYLDVNSNASLKSRNNKLFWGIQAVMTVMDEPLQDSIVQPAYITSVSVNASPLYLTNQSGFQKPTDTIWAQKRDTFYIASKTTEHDFQWDSISGKFNLPSGLQLAYNQNQLSFQFTGVHTIDADKARYRYILEGLDHHWSNVTAIAQSPDYNNLAAGSYTFKVACKGVNGLWSAPATFSFRILPPWWKTWWAYSLYALLFIGAVSLYVSYRSRRLKHENLLLEQKIEGRTSELRQSLQELKATQSQLVQSEKMASLGELTAGIAHEIQNPLNFVNNFSEVSRELIEELKVERRKGKSETGDKLEEEILHDIDANLEKINHHGKRADAIVKGMLQHSQSGTGQKENVDINSLADEYLRLSYHGLRGKDKSFNSGIKTDFDAATGTINIQPQEIGRVLLNLYNNAFYAVNQKKKLNIEHYEPMVTVKTKKTADKILLTVTDNGSGIPKNIVDKIFQPFFTTKPTGEGTGLGLSLSYDIVKANGGEINVESTPGEGTSFIIQLPNQL